MTSMHFACLYGNLTAVKLLAGKNSVMMPKDKDGATPLHLSCIEGNLEVGSNWLAASGGLKFVREFVGELFFCRSLKSRILQLRRLMVV